MAAEGASGPLPFLGGLARSERREDRRLWLRVATDYLLRGETVASRRDDEFLEDYAACLGSLEDFERLAMAKRLLSREPASARVLGLFIAAGGETATFILTHARGLPRETLFGALDDPARAGAVARRDDLDETMVAALLDAQDLGTLAALAGNLLAPLSPGHLAALAKTARARAAEPGGAELIQNLLARASNLPETAPLFLFASPTQRTSILIAAQRNEIGRPRTPAAAARPEDIARLERGALEGDLEDFTATLAQILDCPLALARRIAEDRNGEPLAVALAAIGAPNDVSVRILTAADLRERADYPRVGALARLRDALNPNAARVVAGAMVGHEPRLSPPVVEGPPPPPERRARAEAMAPPRALRTDNLSPAVLRRRKAFAFLAAQTAGKDRLGNG